MCLATAEGGKHRLGGQLLVGAAAPSADASIRVPPPTLPIRYPVMTEPLVYPNSYSFLWLRFMLSDEEPFQASIMVVVSRCALSSSP
jgi:hypothetical protein